MWRKNLKTRAPPMAPLGIKTTNPNRNMCFPCHFCIGYKSLSNPIFDYFWNQEEGALASLSSRAWCRPFNEHHNFHDNESKIKKGKNFVVEEDHQLCKSFFMFCKTLWPIWTKVSNIVEQGATTLQQKSTPNMCRKTNKKLGDKMGGD